MNAGTEQIRKNWLLLIELTEGEHCKGTNTEAPTTRPCKLTYAGTTSSWTEISNNTDDSLKERICKDIDEAKTFK
jgi:hypothetical protein